MPRAERGERKRSRNGYLSEVSALRGALVKVEEKTCGSGKRRDICWSVFLRKSTMDANDSRIRRGFVAILSYFHQYSLCKGRIVN